MTQSAHVTPAVGGGHPHDGMTPTSASTPSGEVLLAELRALRAEVAALQATTEPQQAFVAEAWDEWMPIAQLALEAAGARLADLEARGVLAFGRELVGVGERVVEAFGPDDVRALGDAIVSILTTVRTWTQPGVMSLAQEAGAAVAGVKADDKLGALGVLLASRDDDVQRGAALLVSVLRRVGKAAQRSEASAAPSRPAGWERLAARLGPSGAAPPPPVSRQPSTARAARSGVAASAASAAAAVATAARGADACEPRVVGPRHPIPTGYERLPWDGEGFLAEASAWTEALGAAVAAQHGLPLDAERLAVVAAARRHHADSGGAPNVRKLTQVAGISTRRLYELFPDRPGSTVARVAGLPKPVGCI